MNIFRKTAFVAVLTAMPFLALANDAATIAQLNAKISQLQSQLETTKNVKEQSGAKIGIIDLAYIFDKMPEKEKFVTDLKAEYAPKVAEVDAIKKEAQELYALQQRDGALMNKKKKAETKQKLDKLQADFETKAKTLDAELREKQNAEQEKLNAKVEAAIKDLVAQNKYDLILQKNAVVYQNNAYDVSQQVVDILNSK